MSLCITKALPLPRRMHRRFWSAKAMIKSSSVRKQFKDYFSIDHNHTFVPSSPLKPLFDPTVPFTNAGMNQFKTILQGYGKPPWTRVTNYQKCARVGGKHNDLNIVGSDGYHHTFFEMLGNWSFGDYSKKEACKMAWELLVGPFRFEPQQLYVTYFGGDDSLNIAADMECKEIWLELGVKEDHIIPFGMNDNFWEMGFSGPCGPCTEIHFDHIKGRSCAQNRVNAGFPDLTELWNIVFIQYNRNLDGTLSSLRSHHVDTGMGFERLVASLNGYSSNYDTDIFKPLMDFIHKETPLPIYSGSFNPADEAYEKDYIYRVLSDHSRLLTIAIADGMLPSHEYKLRWVLRKSLRLLFNHLNLDDKLLIQLTNYVAENLSHVYPEVGNNLPKIQAVISNESDIFHSLISKIPQKWNRYLKNEPKLDHLLLMGSNPQAILTAYEKMKAVTEPQLPSSLSILMYESLGMGPGMIEELCNVVGLKFNEDAHMNEIEKYKLNSKVSTAKGPLVGGIVKNLIAANIPFTYDSPKYDYEKLSDKYIFPTINARVVALIANEAVLEELSDNQECGVVLDRTNFYHTAGGQACDLGYLSKLSSTKENFLRVKDVVQSGGYVIHFGTLKGCLKVGDYVELKINAQHRFATMCNHTSAHLLNGMMHKLFKAPSQEGCLIEPGFIKLTYNLHGEEIKVDDVEDIEENVKKTIEDCIPVRRYTVNRWELPPDTIFLPNTIYPTENIHIVDVMRGDSVLSREPCCGTHLLNTGDCVSFCITEVIKHSKVNCSVCAVSGSIAEESVANGSKIMREVENLNNDVNEFLDRDACKVVCGAPGITPTQEPLPNIKSTVKTLLKFFSRHNELSTLERQLSRRLPYTSFVRAESSLKKIFENLDKFARPLSEFEVQDAARNSKFLVHDLQSLIYLNSVLLNKVTRKLKIPVMLFCASKDGEVKIRCCVPPDTVSESFNAEVWIDEVKEFFILPKSGKPSQRAPTPVAQKTSDSALVASLTSLKTHPKHTDNIIKNAIKAAKVFAQSKMSVSK